MVNKYWREIVGCRMCLSMFYWVIVFKLEYWRHMSVRWKREGNLEKEKMSERIEELTGTPSKTWNSLTCVRRSREKSYWRSWNWGCPRLCTTSGRFWVRKASYEAMFQSHINLQQRCKIKWNKDWQFRTWKDNGGVTAVAGQWECFGAGQNDKILNCWEANS